MREKFNQMFKDKLFLVMLVLGLLTIVAAAGVVTIQRGNGQQENPYMDMQGQLLAEDQQPPVAGESDALAAGPQPSDEGAEIAGQENLSGENAAQLAENTGNDSGDNGFGGNTEEIAAADANEEEEAEEKAQAAGTGAGAAKALALDFSDTSKMMWPLRGNVVLDYSMDSTIYFPTLDQYKCNSGLVIQGAVSDPVYAPANAKVLEVGMNEEIGNYLTLDLGNGYTATCGQLKEVAAAAGEYLEQGQLLGYVAEPTKYYTIEGSNVFLELKHEDKTVDPLDYME